MGKSERGEAKEINTEEEEVLPTQPEKVTSLVAVILPFSMALLYIGCIEFCLSGQPFRRGNVHGVRIIITYFINY